MLQIKIHISDTGKLSISMLTNVSQISTQPSNAVLFFYVEKCIVHFPAV